jgi:pimeloyl-ACP methyl ester carboxylesterase
MVDVEGGPGYSTTDSRDYFLGLGRPLMNRRDLLLADARGTGLSGPLDCKALRSSVTRYIRCAGRCARQLGPRVDHYNTRESANDLADVLDALKIAKVDLYGDSYGSYFGQAFAVSHPGRLRSLVLDGTYPLPGTDRRSATLPRRPGGRCGWCARGGRWSWSGDKTTRFRFRGARFVRDELAVATLTGRVDGRRLRATMLVP